jgi:predicted RND superfamily exporter protein
MSENSQQISTIIGFLVVFIMALVFIYPIAVFMACELLDRINKFRNATPPLSPETIEVINRALKCLDANTYTNPDERLIAQAQQEFNAVYGEGKE